MWRCIWQRRATLKDPWQLPGDIIYLPAATWHATYSTAGPEGAEAVVGVGGMGDSTPAIAAAALGDTAALAAELAADPAALHRLNAFGETPVHRAPTAAVRAAWSKPPLIFHRPLYSLTNKTFTLLSGSTVMYCAKRSRARAWPGAGVAG